MYDIFVTLLDVLNYEFMSLYSRRRKEFPALSGNYDRPTNGNEELWGSDTSKKKGDDVVT